MITIDEKYQITADPHCFILQEKKIKGKSGEEYYDNIGYYSNLEETLKGLLKKEIRKFLAKPTACSLEEAIKEFQKIEKHITEINKNY